METLTTQTNTKAGRIAAALTKEIETGRYSPGTFLPAERELAKSYRVSTMTMRKSLGILSEQGHLVKLPQRGVVVADPAQKEPRIGQIAFIAHALNGDTDSYAGGINDALDQERFTLSIYPTHADFDKYRRMISNVVKTRPAGVILTTIPEEYCKVHAEILSETKIPVVTIGHPEIPGLLCDRIDEAGTTNAEKIARFIVQKGYRDIAYMGTAPRNANEETINTLRSELFAAGVKLPEEKIFIFDAPHGHVNPPDPYIDARRAMEKLLADGFRCELLIAGHDYPGVGMLQAILKAGIRVPQEMKVISAMRTAVEGMTPMKLTTVDFNMAEEGRIAIKLLMRRIDGFTGPMQVHHVAVELIEGETT
jgi:DNA-binding LacI/PurR family transcriptional regulator